MNARDLLKTKSPLELKDLLSQAYERIAELEKRNRELERELSKFSTKSAKARQKISSLKGQLKAEKAKVQTLTKTIKVQKVAIKKFATQTQKAQNEVKAIKTAIKDISPKLSKEVLFEIYKSSNQTRFWERVTQVHQIDSEKLQEMKERMATWDSQKLRDVIRMAGWRSTWYDSDAEWNASELARWDERNIYALIMSL